MLSHYPFTPTLTRLGVAACGLAALAACGDNSISGPTLDLSLSRIAGFDPLKAALVQARNEANGGFNLDMWAAVVDRTASSSPSCSPALRPPTSGRGVA